VTAQFLTRVVTDHDGGIPPEPALGFAATTVDVPAPLRAVHTPRFLALLRGLRPSVVVTTCQPGKLVVVCGEGDHLNIRFRAFPSPIGMALGRDRLALGARMRSGTRVRP
jgi:hypothetical protein